MLCASHCNFFEYPQSITGSFIFSLFNFQGPTHFLESFLSVLTEPLSTVRELLYHIYFRLSTLFSKFLKSFLKSLSKLFKSFTQCSQTFLLFLCFPQATSVIISRLFTNCNPFFQFFSNFFEFFKKVPYPLTFSAQLFSKKPLLHINMPYYSYFIRSMQKIYSLFYYNKHSVFILTYLLFRLHIWLAFSIIYV